MGKVFAVNLTLWSHDYTSIQNSAWNFNGFIWVTVPGLTVTDVLPGFWSSDNVSHSVKSTTLKKEGFTVRQSRYTPEQIAFALRQAELWTPVKEVIRKMGISEQTFYRWKKRYGGLHSKDLPRSKVLEVENYRFSWMAVYPRLNMHMIRKVFGNTIMRIILKHVFAA